MKAMKDYHDLKLKTDVLWLTDALQQFRKMWMQNYKLDPMDVVF